MAFDVELSVVIEPSFPENRLSVMQMLNSRLVDKIDRVRIMDDDEFERFVEQWARCLKKKYVDVLRIGSAGDKERVVIAYHDTKNFDMYQCKH